MITFTEKYIFSSLAHGTAIKYNRYIILTEGVICMAVKNIIFDIGNVLVDFRWRDYMRDLGINDEAAKVLGDKMVLDPYWGELDRGTLPQAEIVAEFKRRLPDYTREIDLYWRDTTEMVAARDGSGEWVKSYKDRGFGFYLLSNYPRELFASHTMHFRFLPYVDGRVVSYEVNYIKPEPEIYKALLEKYSLCADERVFIDDNENNIKGAREMGIHAVLYKTREQVIDEVERIIEENR